MMYFVKKHITGVFRKSRNSIGIKVSVSKHRLTFESDQIGDETILINAYCTVFCY